MMVFFSLSYSRKTYKSTIGENCKRPSPKLLEVKNSSLVETTKMTLSGETASLSEGLRSFGVRYGDAGLSHGGREVAVCGGVHQFHLHVVGFLRR